MFPLFLFGVLGFAVWRAIAGHPADDPAALGAPTPSPVPVGPLDVSENPSATVMPNQPYGLPPTGPALTEQDQVDARQMADDVETDLETNGANYNRQMMAAFQRKARLTVDGLYGGRTAGALAYFLGRTAYAPVYSPFQPITYTPPS
jgi:peptidoglycan hydrolase-like protein with peptidoglycan-binding domain